MRTQSVVLILAAGGILLAMAGCCGGVVFLGYRGVTAVASAARETSVKIDDVFAKLAAQQADAAYDRDTTREFKQVTSRAQFDQLSKAISTRLGALRSKRTTGCNVRSINGQTHADVSYVGTFEKGEATITARMQQIQGDWYVAGFRVNSPALQQDLAVATCKHCGEPHAAGAKFCPKCGKPIE